MALLNYEVKTRALATMGYVVVTGAPLAIVAVWASQVNTRGSWGAVALLVAAFIGGLVLHLIEWGATVAGPARVRRRIPGPGEVYQPAPRSRLDLAS